MRLTNGTFKATSARRLDDVNRLAARFLPPAGPLRVLDAAASTGTTTVDWVESLQSAGYTPQLVLADASISAWLWRFGPLDLLLDRSGAVLQVAAGARAFFRPDDRMRRGRARMLSMAIRMLEAVTPQAPATAPRAELVQLVSPRVRLYPVIEVVEQDLGVEVPEWHARFDVVRAANFLNRSYFDRETLTLLAGHLMATLIPGGLFVVCRTVEDGSNTASIIRKPVNPTGVPEVVARIGGGSELEAIMLG